MRTLSRLTVVALGSALAVWLLGTPAQVTRAADEDNKAPKVLELVGKPAPDLEGDFSINSKALRLSDFKGKVVLLDFWAVWCGPCVATFPHLREWQKEYQRDGLVILGATRYYEHYDFDRDSGALQRVGTKVDKSDGFVVKNGLNPAKEREMLKDFAEHHKLENPLLMLSKSEWQKVRDVYHLRYVPTMVLIDRNGIVRMVKVGGSEKNADALHEMIKKLTNRN